LRARARIALSLIGLTLIGLALLGPAAAAVLSRRCQRQRDKDRSEAEVSHSTTRVRLASLTPSLCHTRNVTLFGADLPPGFEYRDDFLAPAEEAELVDHIKRVEFSTFEMRGVVARRRVAFYGASYDRGEGPSPPIPEFMLALREKLAAWAALKPDAFAMALINEYSPGTPIGWHRDAPQYGLIAGVSLLSACRMRLRPYLAPKQAAASTARRTTTHEIELLPRSAYIIRGEARSGYEHSIPAVTEWRYSITLRTLR
jgi:alkylated DNA repair dioxygenase AlkB